MPGYTSNKVFYSTGIRWDGTAEADRAYRNPDTGVDVGFNLRQWFQDMNLGGDDDQSYYRYAMIRGISPSTFELSNPMITRGWYNSMYTYSGTLAADSFTTPAQNIVPLDQLGIDTWGRPLPAWYSSATEQANKRAVGAGGFGTAAGALGGGTISGTTGASNDSLQLGEDQLLGKK